MKSICEIIHMKSIWPVLFFGAVLTLSLWLINLENVDEIPVFSVQMKAIE